MAEPGRRLSLRALVENKLDGELILGQPDEAPADARITLPYKTRIAHLHVIGKTRSGKSRFLADMIWQDLLHHHGLTLIDPHGELYDMVFNRLAQDAFLAKRCKNIHPINLSDPDTTFTYNPLHIDKPEQAYTVASNVVNALARIYGSKDPNETPLIKATINTVCTILAMRGLPLAAAQYFILEGHEEIRRKMIEGVPDPYYRHLGEQMLRMSARDFREHVESAERRLRNFIGNPHVRRIFTTTKNTLNLKRVMDEGHVLLINARKQREKLIDADELRAIGMLITNNLFATAFERDPDKSPRPHFLYIDEVQDYISDDIHNILSQSAKFGLLLTLSHQNLGQLMDAGENLYRGVMNGTLLKLVFQLDFEDALVFVDKLFSHKIDPQRLKEKLATPHTVGFKKTLLKGKGSSQAYGKADTNGTADSEGESETNQWSKVATVGASLGTVASNSQTAFVPNDASMPATGMTLGAGISDINTASANDSAGEGGGTAKMRSHSDVSMHTDTEVEAFSESESEALESILEWFSTTTYSLEDQRYELARSIQLQPPQHGFMAIRGIQTVGFTTRHVPDPLDIPDTVRALRNRLITESAWFIPVSEIPPLLESPELKKILNENAKRPATLEPENYHEPDPAPPEQPG